MATYEELAEGLTYQQMYEVPLGVEWQDAPITIEYAECGSHHIKMSGKVDLEEARRLYAALGALPGVKGNR